MRFCAGVGISFFTDLLQLLACGNHFHIQGIVANKADHFSVGVKGIFPKHRSRGKSFWLTQIAEDEIDRFFLCCHFFRFNEFRQKVRPVTWSLSSVLPNRCLPNRNIWGRGSIPLPPLPTPESSGYNGTVTPLLRARNIIFIDNSIPCVKLGFKLLFLSKCIHWFVTPSPVQAPANMTLSAKTAYFFANLPFILRLLAF
jgi:hypothetical protein